MKHEDHLRNPGGEQLPGADSWEYAITVLLVVAVIALLACTTLLARL